MDELEQAAADERDLSDEELELWARVVDAVTAVVADVEETGGHGHRQLDDGVGIQLTMSPGELSVTTPYWFEGPDAERVVEKLRRVATAVESATDLVAYDPQADAAFLGDGSDKAAASFDRAAVALRALGDQSPTRARSPRWAFWRR